MLRRAIVSALAAVAGCAPLADEAPPAFVAHLIVQMEEAPVSNPPASIWQYRYRQRKVFYVPPVCCDVPSTLYDADGNRLCSPDGGLTGRGDGRCPDFFETRSDELRVWRDPRGK